MSYLIIFASIFCSTILRAQELRLESIEVSERLINAPPHDFSAGTSLLSGKELQKRRQTSVGETLQTEAGVSSTSFGPSSSRPVVRGLEGERVKIFQNSLSSLDASGQSFDHAIPVDVLTLEEVQMIRGPEALLYAPSTVGGVINLVTSRIHTSFEEGLYSKFLVQGESVNDGLSTGAHVNYGKENWVFHVDGATRNLGDQRIPGYARSSRLRRTEPGGPKGKLPNSYNQQDNAAVGVSKIFNRGYAGVSYNFFNTNYGSVAEPDISIDMTQNRFELHSEYRPETNFIRKVRLKSAQSHYHHSELEGGVTGTEFKNVGNETRLEGENKSGDVHGTTGIQTQYFDFSAVGEEAFLPKSRNEKIAVFTLQEVDLGRNAYSLGLRLENNRIKKKADDTLPAQRKEFLGQSASLGHRYDFTKEASLSSTLSYTERAPNFQELYALGAHMAAGTFETGNSSLRKERATALEVTYSESSRRHAIKASAYAQRFADYISMNPTGELDQTPGCAPDCLPVFVYQQVDALFWGLDLSYRRELAELRKGTLELLSKADVVRAKDLDTGYNLPRISPPRLTLGLEYGKDNWSVDGEAQYVADQTKLAPNETKTDAYVLTNLGGAYRFVGERSSLNLFARVRNLFDAEARSHVSTLKEIAPLPGRNFIAGAEVQF